MRELLKALYELQKIDSDALEIERSAENTLRKVRELDVGLEVYRVELGQLNAEVDGLTREHQEIESHAKEESDKHRKWKSRLNEIRSPREYQALSRELEQGERQVRDADEKLLALMVQIEEKSKVIADKKDDLASKESEVSAKVRELREAHAKLLADAEAIRTGREVVKKKIPERVLKKYDQLRAHKNGLAVALIVDGACIGCNVRLRPQHYIEILRFESMEQCPMCQRLLVPDVLVKAPEETAS